MGLYAADTQLFRHAEHALTGFLANAWLIPQYQRDCVNRHVELIRDFL